MFHINSKLLSIEGTRANRIVFFCIFLMVIWHKLPLHAIHLRLFNHYCFPGIDHTEKIIGGYGISDRSNNIWVDSRPQYKRAVGHDV